MARFSETLREYAQYPVNQGRLDNATHKGAASLNGGPPFIEIHLQTDGHIVKAARFEANGCGITIAASSVLTELAINRSLDEVAAIEFEDLIEALDGLPADKHYCGHVALKALHRALES